MTTSELLVPPSSLRRPEERCPGKGPTSERPGSSTDQVFEDHHQEIAVWWRHEHLGQIRDAHSQAPSWFPNLRTCSFQSNTSSSCLAQFTEFCYLIYSLLRRNNSSVTRIVVHNHLQIVKQITSIPIEPHVEVDVTIEHDKDEDDDEWALDVILTNFTNWCVFIRIQWLFDTGDPMRSHSLHNCIQ